MTAASDRAVEKNAELEAALRAARADRGFLVVGVGRGAAVHAATGTTAGFDGYRHPRPLCQPSSSAHFAHRLGDQSAEVTCRRCLATLASRDNAAVGW